uniref:DUF4277 domain-containing protein n=1 Tax=Siminovitchia terrae TaxID=1914933 RepID=UPI001BB3596A
MDKLGLIDRIDQISPVKKEACNVSVGTCIAALIINQLTDRKALCKVKEFYERQDVELLFGPERKVDAFNFIQQKSPTSISGEMNAYW